MRGAMAVLGWYSNRHGFAESSRLKAFLDEALDFYIEQQPQEKRKRSGSGNLRLERLRISSSTSRQVIWMCSTIFVRLPLPWMRVSVSQAMLNATQLAVSLLAHMRHGVSRAPAVGGTVQFLPPYSPELNPIELMFGFVSFVATTLGSLRYCGGPEGVLRQLERQPRVRGQDARPRGALTWAERAQMETRYDLAVFHLADNGFDVRKRRTNKPRSFYKGKKLEPNEVGRRTGRRDQEGARKGGGRTRSRTMRLPTS
mmetsp:Transcript_12002/g.39499  ORF Transcript_12002/g.39499 Transcript_12002/m.39499 type:complete len:256 (-) Transcript_12002:1663-2430(-)